MLGHDGFWTLTKFPKACFKFNFKDRARVENEIEQNITSKDSFKIWLQTRQSHILIIYL